MSTTRELPQPTDDSSASRRGTGASPAATARARRSRWLTLGFTTILVAIAATGTVQALRDEDTPSTASAESTMVNPDTPITLPPTMADLPLQAQGDPTQTDSWKMQTRIAAAGTTVAGRVYRATPNGRSLKVVAARTDLTGKLELAWAADAGQAVGTANCTNNTRLTPESKPKIRPTVMLCWRTSPNLTVYALEIDPKAQKVEPADAAAAVESVWQAAS